MPLPHGGRLIDRITPDEDLEEAGAEARGLKSLRLDTEQAREVENIAQGIYSPIEGFLRSGEYASVLEHARLPGDIPWALPIVLDLPPDSGIDEGDRVALWETDDGPLAVMEVEEIYPLDRDRHDQLIYGTQDASHPGVAKTQGMGDLLAGGPVTLLRLSPSPFDRYRLSPRETRVLFSELGWRQVVGFQTRNVPHLGHEYVQKTALTFADGLFINPVIGKKKKGDFTDEAIHHAIMRKNFGCTHFIVGRDHAGVGDFYHPFAAQEIFQDFPDLGIVPVFFNTFSYCLRCGGVVNEKICPHGPEDQVGFSGTRMRELIIEGQVPPAEMLRPEVAEVLLGISDPFVE